MNDLILPIAVSRKSIEEIAEDLHEDSEAETPDRNIDCFAFVNNERFLSETTKSDLETAFDLLWKRCPETWNEKLEMRARNFDEKIASLRLKRTAASINQDFCNERNQNIEEKEPLSWTSMLDPKFWSMDTVEDCINFTEVVRHLTIYVPFEGRPFIRVWLCALVPLLAHWVMLSNRKNDTLIKTLKYFFASFGQPGVVSCLEKKGASILESLKDSARFVEAVGRGEVEQYYWKTKVMSAHNGNIDWQRLVELADVPLEISQLDTLPIDWLSNGNDWIHVFANVVSPEISTAFATMIKKTVQGHDFEDGVYPGPPKTFARSTAKCHEYLSDFKTGKSARLTQFAHKFHSTFGRMPEEAVDFIWNVVDLARCSIVVPTATDLFKVKSLIEEQEQYTVVSIKNGYNKNFIAKGSGYRDLKLIVKVEFEDLVLKRIPKLQPKTVFLCEVQILCETWLRNKKTTSLSYKILRAESLYDLFMDFAKYGKKTMEKDILAYATPAEILKHGWCNLAKLADFATINADKVLCDACREGYDPFGVRYLIENLGANVRASVSIDRRQMYGYTPLIFAAMNGKKDLVQLLLKYDGGQVRDCTSYGSTALHWATENGHEDIVRILIAAKSNVSARESSRNTALDIAMRRKTGETKFTFERISKLLQGEPVDPKTGKSQEVSLVEKVISAAAEGYLVKFFDANTIDLSEVSEALVTKEISTNFENLLQILWWGGNIRKVSKKGWTALHWVARYGTAETLQLVLDAKADVNAVDNSGWTAFRQVLYDNDKNKRRAMIAALLRAGADIESLFKYIRSRKDPYGRYKNTKRILEDIKMPASHFQIIEKIHGERWREYVAQYEYETGLYHF